MHRFRTVLRAEATGAPEGGATAPTQPAPPPVAPPATAAPAPAPAPAAPPATAQPAAIDPTNPELRKLIAAAAKDAAEKAAKDERAKIEEEARLAKLDAEKRAQAEAKKAQEAEAAAKSEAEKAKAEASFTRGLLAAELVPQTELAESMALAAAQELVKQGVPWSEAVVKVGKDHAYLFKSRQPAAAPAPAAQPTTTPATVLSARTLNTGAPAQPTNGGDAAKTVNAFDMSDEQWKKERDAVLSGRPLSN